MEKRRGEKKKKGRIIRPFAAVRELLLLQSEFFLQIVDIGATILEMFVVHDADLQIYVGFDAIDNQLLQRIFHAGNRDITVFTIADQLADH